MIVSLRTVSASSMVYLDNAASTPPAPEVLALMTQAAQTLYANPSSAHRLGAAAARALEEARAQVAALLGADPEEVLLTSGGTEANALGVLGAAGAARGRHAVVTAIEHPAVLRSVELLGERGWTITAVSPRPNGVVSAAEIEAAADADTGLVAVMLVNNELGTVQPVSEIASGLKKRGLRPHLHVDAVQAAGFLAVTPRALGADSIAISGHKIHGPKGAGALWVRPGVRLQPLWDGGRQERGLRSGTENVAGAAGLGLAADLCRRDRESASRIRALRDDLEVRIMRRLQQARPTVPRETPRCPHIASITLADLPAEPILHALEAREVFASAGSACASRTRGRSHVLKALGVADTAAVLRFSLGRHTTIADIEIAAAALEGAVAEIERVARPARGAGGRAR